MAPFQFLAVLNPDFDKIRRIEEVRYADSDYPIEFYNNSILRNTVLDNESIKTVEESIIDEIKSVANFNCKDHLAENIDPVIINNTLNIIGQMAPSVLYHLKPENIYPSKYGTLILDWEFYGDDNIVSFEVAKNSVGYFVEKDGKNIKQVDEILLGEDGVGTIVNQLQTEILDFL